MSNLRTVILLVIDKFWRLYLWSWGRLIKLMVFTDTFQVWVVEVLLFFFKSTFGNSRVVDHIHEVMAKSIFNMYFLFRLFSLATLVKYQVCHFWTLLQVILDCALCENLMHTHVSFFLFVNASLNRNFVGWGYRSLEPLHWRLVDVSGQHIYFGATVSLEDVVRLRNICWFTTRQTSRSLAFLNVWI